MKADIELSLVHDGKYWVGRNASLEVKGVTIPELDEDLKRGLRESGDYAPGTALHVFMGFDYDTFPTWLRQYHTHYFNRTVLVSL
ncbi:MAG: hypothetical protein GY703_03425 [Gammaproteobacteria bacterium]|nr:hypothetical protein [Gammaproteobacteria bacterium]